MKLRLTCREVTERVLLRRERPWAWHEQIALRMHWAACLGCRRVRGQVALMDGAMGRWRTYREDD